MSDMILQPSLVFADVSENSTVYHGDAYQVLSRLPAQSCQAVMTSPPYWGLRDYDSPGQIGDEDDVDEYIEKLVAVFQELRRVLKDDGTFWLNIGDSYTNGFGSIWSRSWASRN